MSAPNYATDPTVRATVALLAAATGPFADRATELVSTHERCATLAVGALPDLPAAAGQERVELVELYRLGLLHELDELVAVVRRTPVAEGGAAMTPQRTHWSQLVPMATLDRLNVLWLEARQLGKKPRTLLSGSERARLDQVERELDDLVEGIAAVIPVEGMPGLVAEAVEAVRDTRGLQRYYRRHLCPTIRRELPAVEALTDERVGGLADVLAVFDVRRPAAAAAAVVEGGAS